MDRVTKSTIYDLDLGGLNLEQAHRIFTDQVVQASQEIPRRLVKVQKEWDLHLSKGLCSLIDLYLAFNGTKGNMEGSFYFGHEVIKSDELSGFQFTFKRVKNVNQ